MIASADPAQTRDPEIVLDISRLISRVLHTTPTGVDRVEMAYARGLLEMTPDRLAFAAVHPSGFYGRIPTSVVRTFLERTRADWEGTGGPTRRGVRRLTKLMQKLWALRPRPVPSSAAPRILLQTSPHHLHDRSLVETILRRENARLVCLVHDLIPIEYPEYARPNGDPLHRRRVATIAGLASGAISNSEATRLSLVAHLTASGRTLPIHVSHLGLDSSETPDTRPSDRPYFVCIGTIEPRKNHLLLLNIWRRMAETVAAVEMPVLVLIGRRGWENEQVIDMLDRCPALRDCVVERGRTTDTEMRGLLAGARALLLPSFAEGYGMPVPEALASGIPVICSDLPALREAGGDVPDYLDPLDGPAWIAAVHDYTASGSRRRHAQLARMTHWSPPTWDAHVRSALGFIETVARG